MDKLDFRAELERLLALEAEPVQDFETELAEALSAGQEAISRLSRNQDGIALQLEEIYESVQESGTAALLTALQDGRRREERLVKVIAGLCDIVEDFKEYASCDDELARQALAMWRGTVKLLTECGMSRLPGEEGQPFEPEIHSAQAAAPSSYPKGCIERLLRNGYRYNGEIVRKAVVLVSSGKEDGNE